MNRNTKIRTAAFAAAAIMAMSGCGNSPAPVSGDAREIADDFFAGDSSSFTAWKDTDRSSVIASVDEPEHVDFFDITFGDFISEYMYYLITYGIEDDMSADFAESCKNYRVNIINYLTFEKLYLYAADKDYGISEKTLSEDQLAEVRNTADQVRSDWSMSFYAAASAKLGEGASSEAVDKLCGEVLDVVLEKCGIDYDIFYQWELSSKIQELTLAEMLKNVTVSDEQVNDSVNALYEEAEKAAETAPSSYETSATYQMAYVPENTRKARHILIKAEDGNITDDMRAEANSIADQLSSGSVGLTDQEAFSELLGQYDGKSSHIVLRNSPTHSSAYIDALYGIPEKGGVAELLTDSSGIWVIQYTEDAAVSDSDREYIADSIRKSLKSQAESDIQIDAFEKWTTSYKYNIDCDALKIEPEDIVSYGISSSGIIG